MSLLLKTRVWLIRKDGIRQRYHTTPLRVKRKDYEYDRKRKAYKKREPIHVPPIPPPPPMVTIQLSWSEREIAHRRKSPIYRNEWITIPEIYVVSFIDRFMAMDGKEITPGFIAFDLSHETIT